MFGNIASAAEGKRYFVDATSGSDSNSGLTPALAWKTIAKVNAATFAAGNKVLFKRGETWREMLTVPDSGEAGKPLVFGAYGTGAKPKILGSTAVSTWTNEFAGDLLTESFNSTSGNYAFSGAGTGRLDVNGWAGTVGSGSTLDADSTDIADSAGGATQILKIQKVSPNLATWCRLTFAQDNPITHTQFYVYVSAEGLGNTNQLDVAVARDSSSLNTWALRLYQNSGGALQWAGGYSTDGTTSAFTAQSAATGQWYKFDIKYDKTNSRCAWKINGTQIEEFTLTGTLADGVKDLRFGSFAGDATENTYYIDAVKINSSTLGELPANCWRADRSVIPGDSSTGNGPVWFVTSADGKTHHGRKRTSVTECTQAYDWYWSDADNVLVTYSTTDPDSVYSSVEVAEDRDCGVYTDSNSNITFRDLETNYVKFRGFLAGDLGDWDAPAGENILFDGCVSRYTGMIFGTTGGGDGIRTHSANTIIRGCTVHDAGIIGIQLREGANDCIVEHCTAYNNYHFNIAAKVGTADANRPIIRYNLCYTDADYADFTKTTAGVEINLESAESAGRLEDVKIYGNLVYNMNGIGIQLASGADGAEIYNNTIYGVNPSKDAGVWAAGIFVSDELNTNVVVKNNIAVDPGSGGCFVVDDTDLIDAADYNLWYQSAGGSVPYVVADGTQYQSDEQSDYKSATGFDAHSLWESPDFTNAGDNDFTLQSGSPCINAGTDVGLTTDFAGNPIVGNPDIGAYEYQS